MSGGMAMSAMTFELVPSKGVELKNHVGHQVQVTGTMDMKAGDKKSSGTSGSSASTGSTGSSGTSGSGSSTSGSGSGMSGQSSQGSMSGMEHRLHVRSVKMIADSCSGGR